VCRRWWLVDMIISNTEQYDRSKGYVTVLFQCNACHTDSRIRKLSALRNVYGMCKDCYQSSPERKSVAAKIVAARPSFDGSNNPNFKGRIEIQCKCGQTFSVNKYRAQTAKYCSNKCRHKFNNPGVKRIEYEGTRFRSSWEVAFAKYLNDLGISWSYEPEAFETSVGFYTPDFYVPEWKTYVEIKGYFRKDAEQKFTEASAMIPLKLLDRRGLEELGINL